MLSESLLKDIILKKSKLEEEFISPLEITEFTEVPVSSGSNYVPDAKISIKYKNAKVDFLAEIKSTTSLKKISQIIIVLSDYKIKKNENLLLIVPYLNDEISKIITESGISCIDLNGNYLIQTDKFTSIRLDKKNNYKQSVPIRKIYSQDSSIVGRMLLVKNKEYKQVNEIYNEIVKYGGSINLSTISKVLKKLDEDLIISKKKGSIRLVQPKKLLEQLIANYSPPKILSSIKLKIPENKKRDKFLTELFQDTEWTYTGVSSAEYYSPSPTTGNISIYVQSNQDVFGKLKDYEDERFYNIVIYETKSSFVYFNRDKNNRSSILQCMLELSKMDKREKEIAEELKNEILKRFKIE